MAAGLVTEPFVRVRRRLVETEVRVGMGILRISPPRLPCTRVNTYTYLLSMKKKEIGPLRGFDSHKKTEEWNWNLFDPLMDRVDMYHTKSGHVGTSSYLLCHLVPV